LKIVPFVVLVLFFVVIVVSGAKAERDVHFKFYMAEMPEFAQNASWQSFECVCQSGGDRLFHVVCVFAESQPANHPPPPTAGAKLFRRSEKWVKYDQTI
jgi:hypothetical protein